MFFHNVLLLHIILAGKIISSLYKIYLRSEFSNFFPGRDLLQSVFPLPFFLLIHTARIDISLKVMEFSLLLERLLFVSFCEG
jgi:hypothetical protein